MKRYGDNVKWTELYESEEALLSDMMLTCSDPCTAYTWKLVRGYEFIDRFKKYYAKHGKLTNKQMTQLKRLAKEVYRNVHETQKNHKEGTKMTLEERYHSAIKRIGGAPALLDLPQQVQKILKGTTDLKTKVEMLELIAKAK